MPIAFEKCRSMGGKIRTKSMSKNRYMRMCILKGKTYMGEMKTKKKVSKKKRG